MSTSVSQLAYGTLRLGAPPGRKQQANDAWKSVLGQKRVPARLTILADPEPRGKSFGVSATAHVAALTLMIVIPMLFPQKLVPIMHYQVVQLAMPRTEVPLPPEPP